MPAKAQTLRIPERIPPAYDLAEANRLIDKAFDRRGWLETNQDGTVVHDLEKMRHAMYMAFVTNHHVGDIASKTNRRTFSDLVQERSVSKYELYVEVFPDGPGAGPIPPTAEEQGAKDHIADQLWKLCSAANRSGWLQKELAESGLLVIETKKFFG